MQTSAAVLSALVLAALSAGCDPANPVSWETRTVSLQADDFWIDVDGQRYTGRMTVLEPHSDPGWNHYTTLELIWQEREREMRLFIYFKSDGTHWWSDEIRTYDGSKDPLRVDWIYYHGTHFKSPVGQPFTGDVQLLNNGPGDTVKGTIHFRNLRLETRFQSNPGPF